MFKRRKKYKPYIPPPIPDVSPEETLAREKSLRDQIDSASYLQEEKEELKERVPWLYDLFFDPRQNRKRKKQI